MRENHFEQLRKFVAPEIIFGIQARYLLNQYLDNYGIKKPLIVTDQGLIDAGWVDDILAELKTNDIPYAIFSEITPNPRDYEVMKGAEHYIINACNGIVAIGGGSPLDAAKGIGIVATNGGHILDYEGVDEIPLAIPPLICIPSTSGSSADVSQFAIINDTTHKKKIAIISKALVPDISLIDPEICTTMDKKLTAATGLDALTHAIEALVSNASSSLTDLNAKEAIKLVFANLEKAIINPLDLDARREMMLASLLAGLAFSNASLGAVHAMAHALGGLLDLPHGECNAILLPHVVNANYEYAEVQYNKIGEMLNFFLPGISALEKKKILIEKIKELSEKVGITDTLSAYKISTKDYLKLSQNALNDACLVTNPRDMTVEDIRSVYESAR